MQSLRIVGVQTTHMPIKSLIPVTKYDYWGASWKCWTKRSYTLDLDMVYAHINTKDMYVFDKLCG